MCVTRLYLVQLGFRSISWKFQSTLRTMFFTAQSTQHNLHFWKFQSALSLIWILFIYFLCVESSHNSFNSLRFHFCLGVFLVSRNANPRLWLFILSGLHTFSCLKSIFMVIKHFLKVFNWNHVIGFKRRFSYPVMGVKGRFLYPIIFFSGMLIWILGDMWIFDFWVFDILLKSGCLLIWMWDILLLNSHPFIFFIG